MDQIGSPVHLGGSFNNGAGEISETLAVIKVAVNLSTLEVVLIVHEPVGDTVPLQLEDAAVNLTPGQGDVEVLDEGHLLAPFLADALVEGEDYLDLVAFLGQSLGQRTGHIGQTAGFNKGSDLGRGK